ncbi:glycosyltransferase family 4 protein [Rhodanobacter ginsengiterrae]|uniref:glycosyltransferase family 4 protein n=1 Tax=Rhodanobacter ginsengiterrae TaxID=2008451 RepID=UPI003CF574FD
MRFLLVASFPDSIVQFRGALISALRIAGVEVHVAAPGLLGRDSVRTELERLGATVHSISLDRVGTNPIGDALSFLSLFNLMRSVRPNTVLCYTVKPVIYGSLAAWLARVPRRFALITGLGYAFTAERKGILSKIVRYLYAFVLRRVEKVFFQNPDDEALFRRSRILLSSVPSVVVNGSGVEVVDFAVRAMPAGRTVFLMIGRLLGDKGVREYAAAAKLVRKTYPDVRCLLVGWIDDNPDSIVESELDSWVAEGDIEFLGRLEDVRPAIASCNVYVLPSYREGTPRTVLEAMAMGRPVITTDAPGCRETVVDGENGFLIPTKSVDALVVAMKHFVDDPFLAQKMGARSRLIAVNKYDVHKVNALMLREMGILNDGGAPR